MQASETVLPILAHIQANLDGDLSLGCLAERAGYSPFHFHRAFEAEVCETLKAYTLRLRLERAAFRLVFHGGTVLEVAADCGFDHPATFSRAFRRRYGESPTAYRAHGRVAIGTDETTEGAQPVATHFALSRTRIVELKDAHLAFIRHVGPSNWSIQDCSRSWPPGTPAKSSARDRSSSVSATTRRRRLRPTACASMRRCSFRVRFSRPAGSLTTYWPVAHSR